MKATKAIKRAGLLLLALCMLSTVLLNLASCARAPRVEEVYDRVVELLDGAYELNTVFYGEGLPVWATDSDFAEFTHLYFDFPYTGDYERVKPQAIFGSVDEIKIAAARVYSMEYLEGVLFPAAFDGLAVGTAVASSRYLEEGGYFYQSTDDSFDLRGVPIYDYSTMRVVPVGKRDVCLVELDYYLDIYPNTRQVASIRLTLEEDGSWYLSSFSG